MKGSVMEGSWSLGVLIGLPVTIILLLLGLVSLWAGILYKRSEHAYSNDGWPWIIGSVAWIVVVLGFAAWAFYPYKAEYHRWEPVSGTVEAVESRLLRDGSGMQEKFVVRFEGDPQQYGIEDTRAALIKVGDEITITCKRAWQYAGVDGYDCRWAEGNV